MTREEAKKLLPYMQAFAEGKTVQWQDSVTNEWQDDNDPNFHPVAKWRIKPEPREVWVVYVKDEVIDASFSSKEEAEHWAFSTVGPRGFSLSIVKFREVMDE